MEYPIISKLEDLLSHDALRLARKYNLCIDKIPALVYGIKGNESIYVATGNISAHAAANGIKNTSEQFAALAIVHYELCMREQFDISYTIDSMRIVCRTIDIKLNHEDVLYYRSRRGNNTKEDMLARAKYCENAADYLAQFKIIDDSLNLENN